MTPQEQKMLDDLIARVDSTRLDDRDPEAAQRIEQWASRNRDAAYILAQTVLVQSYALEQAKAQIQALQQRSANQQQAKPTSFLGGLFGHKEEPPPTRPQQAVPAAAPTQPQGYAPVPQYGQPSGGGYTPQASGAPQAYAPAGGGSSFLRSAATTAAGVAAGALAFQGIESLMHGFGHTAGFGGGDQGLGNFGGRPEETVINNYYDSPSPAGSHADAAGANADIQNADTQNADIQQFAHEGDSELSTQQDQADGVALDDGGEQVQADTDLPDIDSDGGSFDDASLDDSSFSDDGSFDDDLNNS